MRKIRTSAVGQAIGHSAHLITKREVMAYAASIGDASDGCFDDAGREVIAPLSFCVVLEWPLVNDHGAFDVLGIGEAEQARSVHVLQESVLARPLQSGTNTTTDGAVVEVRSTRVGTYVCYELTTREKETGEIVVTSRLGQMYLGVECDAVNFALLPARTRRNPPAAPPSNRLIDKVAVARGFPHVYSECSRIWNPIHTEIEAATNLGLPGIIVHGTASWALACQSIVKHYCNGDHARLRRLSARFRRPIRPASTIQLTHSLAADGNGVNFEILNDAGDVALDDGHAAIISIHQDQ